MFVAKVSGILCRWNLRREEFKTFPAPEKKLFLLAKLFRHKVIFIGKAAFNSIQRNIYHRARVWPKL